MPTKCAYCKEPAHSESLVNGFLPKCKYHYFHEWKFRKCGACGKSLFREDAEARFLKTWMGSMWITYHKKCWKDRPAMESAKPNILERIKSWWTIRNLNHAH